MCPEVMSWRSERHERRPSTHSWRWKRPFPGPFMGSKTSVLIKSYKLSELRLENTKILWFKSSVSGYKIIFFIQLSVCVRFPVHLMTQDQQVFFHFYLWLLRDWSPILPTAWQLLFASFQRPENRLMKRAVVSCVWLAVVLKGKNTLSDLRIIVKNSKLTHRAWSQNIIDDRVKMYSDIIS